MFCLPLATSVKKSSGFVPLIVNPRTTSGALPLLVTVRVCDGLTVPWGMGELAPNVSEVGLGSALVAVSNIDTLAESELATARSCPPSPFRSPTATEYGSKPTLKVLAAPNEPEPRGRA